jgi:hypothetical protein
LSQLNLRLPPQVDWPYPPISGRDNSYTPGTASSKCAVLDRLPHFQYRMRADAPFQKTGVRTTDPPGACHMGRAATLPLDTRNCWAANFTATHANMYCDEGGSDGEHREAPRRPIKSPHQMVAENLRSRQHCGQCSAAPSFHAPDGSEMPVPEVGYGRPFRWEMARVLAGESGPKNVYFCVSRRVPQVDLGFTVHTTNTPSAHPLP